MIRFEPSRDEALIRAVIACAWDRPEMLVDGADRACIRVSTEAQYFLVVREKELLGLFAAMQQSPICADLHVCLLPQCRGRLAVEICSAFLAWLGAHSPYRKVIGSIPAYNRPMRWVARAAGMRELAINARSTIRGGRLEDQVIVEKELAK